MRFSRYPALLWLFVLCSGCATSEPGAEEIAAARAAYTAPTEEYRCEALDATRSDAELLQRLAAERSRFNTEGLTCERTLVTLADVFSFNQKAEGRAGIKTDFADETAQKELGGKSVELFRREASFLEVFDRTARQAGARWWAKDGVVVLGIPVVAE